MQQQIFQAEQQKKLRNANEQVLKRMAEELDGQQAIGSRTSRPIEQWKDGYDEGVVQVK